MQRLETYDWERFIFSANAVFVSFDALITEAILSLIVSMINTSFSCIKPHREMNVKENQFQELKKVLTRFLGTDILVLGTEKGVNL